MKLRTFKKSLHRKNPFKRTPRYESQIFGSYNEHFHYYTCHKLSARYDLYTGKLTYEIKGK